MLYLELITSTGLRQKIEKNLKTSPQGWNSWQIILSLIMLNLAGGDCVDDIERLESDGGLRALFLKFETHEMTARERRIYKRRWRKQRTRVFPSASAHRRFLKKFHHERFITFKKMNWQEASFPRDYLELMQLGGIS